MDRKQFWILICIINAVCGSAVDYLRTKASDGTGEANIYALQTIESKCFDGLRLHNKR
jgi:hypothetical protein